MRKTHWSRLWLFAVLASVAMVPANGQRRIVLGIEGDWWDSAGNQLGFASELKGECVFGQGGSLQVVDSTTERAQTLAYEKMSPDCPSSCPARPAKVPERSRCGEAKLQPKGNMTQAGLLSSLNLGNILNYLVRRPQMYVVAAARGLGDEPQEAVLPITGSAVQLKAAMEPLPAGTYTVNLEAVGAQGRPPMAGKIVWQPGGQANFPLSQPSSGLYRLQVALEGGDSEGSEAWVLFSPPAHYEADAKDFHQAVEITKSWGDRVDMAGKRALLRATLQSLAERETGK